MSYALTIKQTLMVKDMVSKWYLINMHIVDDINMLIVYHARTPSSSLIFYTSYTNLYYLYLYYIYFWYNS